MEEEAFVSRALEAMLASRKWGPVLRDLFAWYDAAPDLGEAAETELRAVEIALPDAAADLRAKGESWLSLFRKLQDMSYGQVLLGRRGRATRFEWREPPAPLARLALRLAGEAAPGAPSKPADAGPGIYQVHPFPLRQSLTVEVRVPRDVTREELHRLADFTRLLPARD